MSERDKKEETMSDKIEVRKHTRSRPKKHEAEEPFVMEVKSIAPEKGDKIIDAKTDEPNREIKRGVTRVGGGDHGKIEKGVKRLGY